MQLLPSGCVRYHCFFQDSIQIGIMNMAESHPSSLHLVLLSGLSGSGKTVALHALEDLEFYCADNLPVSMLPAFVDEFLSSENAYNKVAVGIDARNPRGQLADIKSGLADLEQRNVDCQIVFLTATTKALLQRFSETRRRHPLSRKKRVLKQAIEHERGVLAELEQSADFRIDTSDTNVHELRERMWKLFRREEDSPLSLVLQSFAFKRGVPQDIDFLFDARCLPNPHWDPLLRQSTGQDEAVREWLGQHTIVQDFINDISVLLKKWIPGFVASQRSYITIAIGCTGGRHRSVFIAERLAMELSDSDQQVQVHHRDLSRGS
jgi:UPF0042 nucleotide-binding protein